MSEGLVAIGRVIKPHGIRGEVSVLVLSEVEGRFEPGDTVQLGGVATTIASSRPHQGRLLVRFEGIADRTAAEPLRGRLIEAPPADLDDTENYYVHELIGMAVVTADGDHLGEVSDHVELPAAAGYDLLEVTRDDGTTWLLPAVDEYVEVGELPDGTELLVVVDPPEGLVSGEAAVVRSEGEVAPGGPEAGAT
ncbi:ribosome maturation factor RimM [Nitriliruptor alkaliphilus]|uniref:ribosome maturation factor RimM n=1 Tax=Nitriliruptor alkaliphilus TaxID=427918 RepID=UPI00069916BE|nr:ribosome maturation factor RimM [Nitriliruptor alkaliphilus]